MTKACDGVGVEASVGSGTSETFTLSFASFGSSRSLSGRDVERSFTPDMKSSVTSGFSSRLSPSSRCVSGVLFCVEVVNESRGSTYGCVGGVRVGTVGFVGAGGTLFVVGFVVVVGGEGR
jgi:hypothetical protein